MILQSISFGFQHARHRKASQESDTRGEMSSLLAQGLSSHDTSINRFRDLTPGGADKTWRVATRRDQSARSLSASSVIYPIWIKMLDKDRKCIPATSKVSIRVHSYVQSYWIS